jgi:hypothetical protein
MLRGRPGEKDREVAAADGSGRRYQRLRPLPLRLIAEPG